MSKANTSNSAATASEATEVPGSRFGIRPVVICWFVLTVTSTIGIEALDRDWFGIRESFLDTVFLGVLFGQIALATIIGGLIARNWVTSWFVSVVLACFLTALSSVFAWVIWQASHDLGRLALCALWPVLLLSTCAPLVLLRSLFGWTLTRDSQVAIPRWRSSLEDLLLVGAVTACSMTISQVFLYAEGPNNLSQLLMVMAAFAALSLICIPLVVYVTFRSKNWGRRILGWALLSAVAFGVVVIEDMLMRPGGVSVSMDNLPHMLIGIPAGCLTIAVGLTCLLASGYRLTYFEKVAKRPAIGPTELTKEVSKDETLVDSAAPFEAEWLSDLQPETVRSKFDFGPQWQARIITVLLVCIAGTGVLMIQLARQKIVRFYEQLGAKVIDSTIERREIKNLRFAPDFADADLQLYTKHAHSIHSLSFAGTKITDAIVPQLKVFQSVVDLDLSDTAITDAGLKHLHAPTLASKGKDMYEGFASLSLANTKVTWPAIVKFTQIENIHRLDVSGLGITDAQLAQAIKVKGLTLSRNSITDEGVATLLDKVDLKYLDLSDTQVTGAALQTWRCPAELILDGTQIDDATLLGILKIGKVKRISLARTNITAAVLPSLAGLFVRLGEGRITEDDLGKLPLINFQHLGLNDKKFTGKSLLAGKIQVSSLDLSDSSVTDDIIVPLVSGRYLSFIGLANTQISDQPLASLFGGDIDLRGTRVTANGLAHGATYVRISVAHNQFTPREMAQLEHTQVRIEATPSICLGPR